MSDIAAYMNEILESKSHKSLFNDYKKASDENNAEMMEPGPNVSLVEKEEDPMFMAKYPNVMQLLNLLDAEQKFPALMNEINSGRFDDVSSADDENYAMSPDVASDIASLRAMIDVLNHPDMQREFEEMVSKMDLPETNELVVDEQLDGMGDMQVAENIESDATLDTQMMDYASADLAIDSLLTASAALDKLSLSRSAQVSLQLAALVVEAKKKGKKDKEDESDDDKKEDKKSKKDKEDKKSDKEDKKNKKEDKKEDKKDKEDKKSKKNDKDEDKNDKSDKKSDKK